MGCSSGGASFVPLISYAYVGNRGGTTVSQYRIVSDGTLLPLTTPTVAAGNHPSWVAVHPNSLHAYVTNLDDGTVSQFNIGADGMLSPLAPATVGTGGTPRCIDVEPNGSRP